MTLLEQRIAIAEFVKPPHEAGCMMPNYSCLCGPHYPCDLNAMHEAESLLKYEDSDTGQTYIYADWIWKLVGNNNPKEQKNVCFRTIHATAAQRAEALLRTIGKWQE